MLIDKFPLLAFSHSKREYVLRLRMQVSVEVPFTYSRVDSMRYLPQTFFRRERQAEVDSSFPWCLLQIFCL